MVNEFVMATLNREIPIHMAEIRALYERLDRMTGLSGASESISFDFSTESLGAYVRDPEDRGFRFSLLFIGYGVKNPLKKEDREDLFKHEYAHYMQYNMKIPEKYKWQPGTHGSAWKYCCSIVGAAPTPYYRAGEGLMEHDYDKVLKKKINDKSIPIRDVYRREQAYQRQRNTEVKFQVGDSITHPAFGQGIVESVEPTASSVTLSVRFGEQSKKIDQTWLLKQMRS